VFCMISRDIWEPTRPIDPPLLSALFVPAITHVAFVPLRVLGTQSYPLGIEALLAALMNR